MPKLEFLYSSLISTNHLNPLSKFLFLSLTLIKDFIFIDFFSFHIITIFYLFKAMQHLQDSYKGMLLDKISLNLLDNFKKGYCGACAFVQGVHGRISESEQFAEISKIMTSIKDNHKREGLQTTLSLFSCEIISKWVENSLYEDQSCTGKTLMVAPFNHELIEYYISSNNLINYKLYYYKEV
jgi:hypothetical protein